MINETLTDEQRAARAKRAVEAFRRMQPMLNSYARAFTGNKRITVEISSSIKAATDGKKIYFCPPIGLGDELKHEKNLCDRRDPETLLQMCKACEVKEGILVVIYHEIAHVCYGTFQAPDEQHAAELVDRVLAETSGAYAERMRKVVDRAPSYVKDNFMGMASLINPYLKIILNAIEDARVNNNLFAARRGTKAMFDAASRQIFERGIEMIDPKTGEVTYSMWKERELNMQVIIGIFCAAVGYEYDGWFAPEVIAALADHEIQGLLAQSRGTRSVGDNYALSFLFLKRLRELGFCKNPNDPEDEQPEQEPDQETGDGKPSSEADDSEGDSSDPQDDSESDEGDGQGDGNSDDADGAEGDGDESTDQQGDGASEAEADGPSDGDESEGDTAAGPVAGDQDESAGDDSGTDDEGMGDDSDSSDTDELREGEQPGTEADEPGEPGDGADSSSDDRDQSGGAAEDSGEADEFDSGEQSFLSDDGVEDDTEETSPTTEEYFDEGEDEREREELEDNPDAEEIDQGGMVPEDAIDLTDVDSNDEPLNYGDPESAEKGLEQFGGHDKDDEPPTPEDLLNQAALEKAIMQGLYFETASEEVVGVREHRYGVPVLNAKGENTSTAWTGKFYANVYTPTEMGMTGNYRPNEATLGKPLLKLRTVFESNARSHNQAHLKSGRVNGRVLGKRAPLGDERLFRKKIIPGKRDYFVVIGLDISGSTIGRNLGLIKSAAWAQAELLTRLGIPFAVYAFTAAYGSPKSLSVLQDDMYLDMYLIKEAGEPWNKTTQDRLQKIGPDGGNLDGHNLEYFRKVCDKSTATDKIIMYYSDGRMPASNYDEELEILRRELDICKKKGYTVCGVGIRTDSPKEHGLPTVQVNEKDDVMQVVTFLETQLRRK